MKQASKSLSSEINRTVERVVSLVGEKHYSEAFFILSMRYG